MKRLAGKVVLITGAGGGIGREHALLMAAEGAQVVVNDVGCAADGTGSSDAADRVVAEIRAAGGEAIADCRAVGTFASAEQIVAAAVNAFGRLDVLVNNAGILRDRTLLKMSEAEWQQVIEVHLTGSFACLQAAARVMQQQGTGGRIINTSSSSGLLGQFGQCNYGAAKAGIYAITRIAALELAKFKITVNAIAPAALTRMMLSIPGVAETIPSTALGPEFIAPVAAWLASDEAASVSGQVFGVEGNHVFIYRMMTSHGRTRHTEPGPWTIDELAQHLRQIVEW
ncbi:MAG TPA: SDR family NAD(P)-dependent oxidoreductase [Pirellulales bacterium]|jgi:NAD(P)-dependent dehydrogenase (short-subunit alcohol dehydrogenase family)|nr:SDR family NAD(P)-dependent oxidoreductase [Pirellulales bacterium]